MLRIIRALSWCTCCLVCVPVLAQDDQAHAMLDQALQLHERQRTREAIPLARQGVALREKSLGPQHPDTANAQNILGVMLTHQAQYAEARRVLEAAVGTRKKVLGPEHPKTLETLNNLASTVYLQGDTKAARDVMEEALRVSQRVLGPEHESTANLMSNLGMTLEALGDRATATKRLEEAVRIRRKVLGEHADTAFSLYCLGGLQRVQGDLPAARQNLEEALRMGIKLRGEQHPDSARAMNELGLLYKDQGDYAQALALHERALRILLQTRGEVHPDTVAALNSIGSIYSLQEKFAEALPYFERSLAIRKKIYPGDHPQISTALNNLAYVVHAQGDAATALKYYEQSLAMLERLVGPEHADTALALNNVAWVKLDGGDAAGAQPLYEQSLDINRRLLGEAHPATIRCLHSLAGLHARESAWEEAAKYADQARRASRKYLVRSLPAMSDREQLLFLRSADVNYLHGVLSMSLTRKEDSRFVDLAAGWLLNSKGTAQEALAARTLLARDARDPRLAAQATELSDVRRQLAMLAVSRPKSGQEQAHRAEFDRLSGEEQRLSRTLAQQDGRSGAADDWLELADFRAKLPADAVYIDIARFKPYDYSIAEAAKRWRPARYAAWIVPPAGAGPIKLIDLGPAAEVDDAISQVRTAITTAAKAGDAIAEDEGAAETKLQADLERVAHLVWKPIAPEVTKAKRLIVCPDGPLWLLPWAALPVSAERRLLEDFALQLVTSGRDIGRAAPQSPKPSGPLIFADPDFDLRPTDAQQATQALFRGQKIAPSDATRSLVMSASLPRVGRLPNTATEAKLAAPNMAQVGGAEPISYTDRYALETVAKAVQRPKLLLFATHGFFLSDQEPVAGERGAAANLAGAASKPAENPLLRCGLLLAGCNVGQQAGDDGILTGLEITSLDLRGTELVVLSACETGIGKVNNGEGVAGLRQAFQLAGAQAVVSTLWQVPDRDSAIIMNDFFENLANGQTKADALRNSQLKRIAARREKLGAAHPFFWAAWTMTGN